MASPRVISILILTMAAFAANSVLNRAALTSTSIDPALFTSIRLVSGAFTLVFITAFRSRMQRPAGSWLSAAALSAYAIAFSFAYVDLSAATGALLLFGAVQSSMIVHGLYQGERYSIRQILGMCIAIGGLAYLLLPGISSPPLPAALLMIIAGVAWGLYSVRGRRSGNALADTTGNFVRSLPAAVALAIVGVSSMKVETNGIVFAVCSGALASGVGYALWYSILPLMRSGTAAIVQLSVPPIAAVGAILFLNETLSVRLVVSSLLILGGIGLVLKTERRRQ